jgi:hypothetical protein
MGRPKGSDIRERMEHLKRERVFDGKVYDMSHHENYGTKENAQKDAEHYRKRGYNVRVINRGRGRYSIYMR